MPGRPETANGRRSIRHDKSRWGGQAGTRADAAAAGLAVTGELTGSVRASGADRPYGSRPAGTGRTGYRQ